MIKKVNRYTTNEFQDWQRIYLPGRFIIQDIDTWALVVSNSENDYEPLFIVELKRSFIDPEKWEPFKDDQPNYNALYKLSKRADLPFITIYFKKGEKITNDSKFAIFEITHVNEQSRNWIEYNKKITTAKQFIDEFPRIY